MLNLFPDCSTICTSLLGLLIISGEWVSLCMFPFTLNDFPLHSAHRHGYSGASRRFQSSLSPVTQAVQFKPALVLGVWGFRPLKRSYLSAVRPSSYCQTSASPFSPGHRQMILYFPVVIGHVYLSFSSWMQSLGPAHPFM